ncbi:MAG: hypothetical protein BJ554DRAFT_7963 [Olpidium bornovanus]|uniref:Uncharacterized protein n=1 Tax=Olpidium bornovanus TaxID=278681 RepID=A0A8H7ZV63_9FUNG|nr:MAG: hypothetical protein BJ554DRAFT_7963 [Olpidium bornovanus]
MHDAGRPSRHGSGGEKFWKSFLETQHSCAADDFARLAPEHRPTDAAFVRESSASRSRRSPRAEQWGQSNRFDGTCETRSARGRAAIITTASPGSRQPAGTRGFLRRAERKTVSENPSHPAPGSQARGLRGSRSGATSPAPRVIFRLGKARAP